tara:strand:- start:744 stop:1019 length:276 start_codon:yes stop_codon:yes gene_type:complete
MDAQNLRELIRNYLSQRPRNTIEISTWLSRRIDPKNRPADITSILESDDQIMRIGTVRQSGMHRADSPVSEWASSDWVEHHERNESNKKES